MIQTIQKRIKTNIAQYTKLFDIENKDVVCTTKNNKITIPTLEGEYTLSNATDGIASKGCLNDTHVFENGICTTNSFFGKEESTHNLIAHKVNVCTAFKRDVAKQMVTGKENNVIIIYLGDARNVNEREIMSTSRNLSCKFAYTIGILFKLPLSEMNKYSYIDSDKLFINSVVGAVQPGGTLVEAKNILDRFYVGNNFVTEIEFGFTIDMFLEQNFIDSLKKL